MLSFLCVLGFVAKAGEGEGETVQRAGRAHEEAREAQENSRQARDTEEAHGQPLLLFCVLLLLHVYSLWCVVCVQGKGRRKKIVTKDKFGEEIPEQTVYKWKLERKR